MTANIVEGHALNESTEVDGEVISVAVSIEVVVAIDNVMARHRDELGAALAPFGLSPFDIIVPNYRRIVTRDELR